MNKKIVIVGAGPIGCFTAQLLKIHNIDTSLIEEHGEVGKPLHCTGLVGSKVFSEKRAFKIPDSSVLNVINGAVIHYDKQSFSIRRDKVAYVIDRTRFDKELSRGLEISFNNRFIGVEKTGSGFIIETERDEFPADIIIGADGANSAIRRLINNNGATKQLRGIQLRIKLKCRSKDMVEVYLKKGFFIWIVPEAEDVARVGTISDNPYKDLQLFLKEEKIRGKILERFGGFVSVGICDETVKGCIAIVGDAACQIKPLTYGGVYFGLRSASLLAESIRNNRLTDYDGAWKKELASEIKIGMKIRGLYNNFSNEEIGKLFRLLKKEKSLIEKIGDFENHSRLALEIIKKPSLYPQLGELLKIIFNSIF